MRLPPCPFKLGQRWALNSDPSITGAVRHVLFSRAYRHEEAWVTTDERYESLHYPFPADDPTRSKSYRINVYEWHRV